MMKKKVRTRIVSLSNGTAERSADTRILSPSIPEMVLSGLSTLKDLRTFKLVESLAIIMGRYPLITMMKSRMFQESRRYEPLGMIKPRPIIFKIISAVYKPKNTQSKARKKLLVSSSVGSSRAITMELATITVREIASKYDESIILNHSFHS